MPSLDEDNEERLSDGKADDGHSSDEELVLSPLLSPTHTVDKSTGMSPPVLPPLFLKLWYFLEPMPTTRDDELQEREKDDAESLLGEGRKVGSGKPPLCFRK